MWSKSDFTFQELEPSIGEELIQLWDYSPDKGSAGARGGRSFQSQNFKSPRRKPFSQSQPPKNFSGNSSQGNNPQEYVSYDENQGYDFQGESQNFQGQQFGFQGHDPGFQGYNSWSQGHQNFQGHQQLPQSSQGYVSDRQGFGSQGHQGQFSGAAGHGFYGNYQGQGFHGFQGHDPGFHQMGVGYNSMYADNIQRVNSPQYSRSPVTILQRDGKSHRN